MSGRIAPGTRCVIFDSKGIVENVLTGEERPHRLNGRFCVALARDPFVLAVPFWMVDLEGEHWLSIAERCLFPIDGDESQSAKETREVSA